LVISNHNSFRVLFDKIASVLASRMPGSQTRWNSAQMNGMWVHAGLEWALSSARRCASEGTGYGPVSVCVCLSVTSRGVLSKWLDGSSWFLARELPSTCHTLCFKEIQVSGKIRYFPLEVFLKLGFKHFATAYRSSNVLPTSSIEKGGRSHRDKSDRRWSTKLTIPRTPTLDRCSLSHGDHEALSTARFRRAGQLTTADTWMFCSVLA